MLRRAASVAVLTSLCFTFVAISRVIARLQWGILRQESITISLPNRGKIGAQLSSAVEPRILPVGSQKRVLRSTGFHRCFHLLPLYQNRSVFLHYTARRVGPVEEVYACRVYGMVSPLGLAIKGRNRVSETYCRPSTVASIFVSSWASYLRLAPKTLNHAEMDCRIDHEDKR